VAFVELVEDDDADVAELRVGVELAGEQSFGDEAQAGRGRGGGLEADLIADAAADRVSATRWADMRAAMRRGWRTRTSRSSPASPASSRARGIRVVLPAPGGASTTSERPARRAASTSGSTASIGSCGRGGATGRGG
jgi:hypothetical protein